MQSLEALAEVPSIVILRGVRTWSGRRDGSVYYHAGNFFKPLDIHGSDHAAVKVAIRKFCKANKELIEKDRSQPWYLTLSQLMDLEPFE